MTQNDKFQFVVHRENFLSNSQCDKLIKYLDELNPNDSELAGKYNKNILNKKVRDNKEVIYKDDVKCKFVHVHGGTEQTINNKLKMIFELSNLSIWDFHIENMEEVKLLKYGVGGKYEWHTDCGSQRTSKRKLTAVVQLSDSNDYEGGNLEFGITEDSGEKNYTAPRTKGSITIFPAFLSHRVTPITNGTRYSLITWMLGNAFK